MLALAQRDLADLARAMRALIREPALRDSHEDVYAYWSNTIAAVIRTPDAGWLDPLVGGLQKAQEGLLAGRGTGCRVRPTQDQLRGPAWRQ